MTAKFFVEKSTFIKDLQPANQGVCYLLAKEGVMRHADGRWTERMEVTEHDVRIGFAMTRDIQEREIMKVEGYGRARAVTLNARKAVQQRIKDRPLREAIATVTDAREKAELATRQARSRAVLAEKHPELADVAKAEAALNELKGLLNKYPHAARMTRKGILVDADENPVSVFENLSGMKAWLFQNGFRASVDDREYFVAAAK